MGKRGKEGLNLQLPQEKEDSRVCLMHLRLVLHHAESHHRNLREYSLQLYCRYNCYLATIVINQDLDPECFLIWADPLQTPSAMIERFCLESFSRISPVEPP